MGGVEEVATLSILMWGLKIVTTQLCSYVEILIFKLCNFLRFMFDICWYLLPKYQDKILKFIKKIYITSHYNPPHTQCSNIYVRAVVKLFFFYGSPFIIIIGKINEAVASDIREWCPFFVYYKRQFCTLNQPSVVVHNVS